MDRNKPYLLGMYEKSMPADLSWKEKLENCRAFGFDWLEISIDETEAKLSRLDWTPGERQALIKTMQACGVPISTMCLSGHRKYPLGSLNPKGHRRSLEIMEKAIDLASDLGIRLIQLAGYDVYYEEGSDQTRREFIRNLCTAVGMAAKKGVILGFETMETPFMDTVEKAMDYVQLIDSPYLGIYPDIGNLTNASQLYHVPVPKDIEKGKGHLFAAHLKETRPGVYREVPFGTGHTNYPEDLRKLKELGVRMFTGEFWHTEQNPDYPEICRQAACFLRRQLDEVFHD